MVVQYHKDTVKCKQFTTEDIQAKDEVLLCSITKIQLNVSNSQLDLKNT
ncbi:Uncharacterised protein [Elizabethkingia meningoseptica]|nr:Uncharacterised protein [Elizabethkingia meningoseptica]